MTPEELIDMAIANIRHARLERWKFAKSLCESPIEELYLAAVYSACIDNTNPVHIYGSAYENDKDLFEGDHLFPQAKVGNYRLDFLFINVSRNGEQRLVAVECDGHNFHEKTKAQAAHDKARDRFLVGRGIRVLRFTGSEIYRDPFACWGETLNVLWGLQEAA